MLIRHLNGHHMSGWKLCKLTWHNRSGSSSLQLHRFFGNSLSRELAPGRRGWTQDDIRKLKDLHACGMKSQAIAEQLGRSKWAVHGFIRRLRHNKGLEVQAPNIVPHRHYAWTEDDDILLRSLHRERKAGVDIAKALGRTQSSIQTRLHNLGLTTKRVNPPRPTRRSQADYERALELRAAGNTVKHIADVMGLPYTTVKNWTKARPKRPFRLSMEEAQKIRDMRDRGEQIATICAALPNLSYNTISGLITRLIKEGSIASRAKSWSEEEKQKVVDLVTAGVPFKTIATQLPGRREAALRALWRKLPESRI